MTDQNQKPENPPAFPVSTADVVAYYGMSMWGYYAAHALAGLCANPKFNATDLVTDISAHLADLMFAEQAKRGIR